MRHYESKFIQFSIITVTCCIYLFSSVSYFQPQRIWLIFDEDVSKLNQSEWEKKNTLLWRQVLFNKTSICFQKLWNFIVLVSSSRRYLILDDLNVWDVKERITLRWWVRRMFRDMLSSSSELLLSLFWHSSQCSRPGTLILIVIYIQYHSEDDNS